jgi:hypothetical protein
MAGAVVSLLRDGEGARMMGNAARARIVARYTWEAQLRLLEEALAPAHSQRGCCRMRPGR